MPVFRDASFTNRMSTACRVSDWKLFVFRLPGTPFISGIRNSGNDLSSETA